MPPSFRNPIVAGIVAAFFFLLTTLHVFVASDTSSLAASLVGREGITVLGFIHDVDIRERTLKVRWEVISRNVANNASILVYVDQSASPSGSVVSFLLPEGKDDVHPVTQHTLDGSWKEWAKSDNPFPYPFDRYTFSGNVSAFDAKTLASISLSSFAIADNRAGKHLTPVPVLTLYPDSKTDDGSAFEPQTFGALVERPIPLKVATFAMFGASWIFTLSVVYAVVAVLLWKRELASRRLIEALLGAIAIVVILREMGARDARPDYGVLLDYVGMYVQIVYFVLLIVAVHVAMRHNRTVKGEIALSGDDTI